jgi:hypothetical protein
MKKHGNMTSQKVNKHTKKGSNDSEVHKISHIELKGMMIRMINNTKEDV